ncbi:unnamed protein product [Adineta steineri]|uniref:Peptidase C14 caspase domain-containing protein n=1 Tax=Adineta steineri TaxID=433720 RepID=A0A813QNB5_9BILA|nr:unnamed protein product [Adineta steineri]CAF3713825.1 unnamed protein product [Adineta steineri]
MQQGLSSMNAPSETVIAFSCAAGEATLDETGNNRNGIFTENLLKYITMPNKDIEELLKNVSRDVKQQTGGYQKPYRTSSLTEDVFLVTKRSREQFQQFGITAAGGNGKGRELSQLDWPHGIFINNKKSIYIADCWNHRIVKWKLNSNQGQIIAGGNGKGNQKNQLSHPRDIIFDKQNNSFIISDRGNRRVIRYFDNSQTNQQIIISNINCWVLTIDKNGFIYVSDYENHEVRRWKQGDDEGELVAGGNGRGDHLNQLNNPTNIYIDEDYSLYISDEENHRVMKWKKDAKEGIIVAGGNGYGDTLKQLHYPEGVIVDNLGQIYVADVGNDRVMRWCEGDKEGEVVVGGNGKGDQPNQLHSPRGLSFDNEENLYVADMGNHRIQKYERILN